jgi:hypothetical protein
MRTVLIAATLASTLIGLTGQARACNVAVPGCQQSMYDAGAALQGQIIRQMATPIAPPAPMPTPSMSFGAINGHPYSVQRFGNWTDIQVGQ